MDCAIPQDITHMESNIQDNSLLNPDNVCLSTIDHKDTIALRNFWKINVTVLINGSIT